MDTQYYRFFDTILSFSSNSHDIEKEFRRIFGWFAVEGELPADITCSIEKRKDSYYISAKSRRYSMDYVSKENLPADVYLSLFSPVIYAVKDFFLIHAGSLLTEKGESLIISAPCGFGKTTLTMELVRQGFGWLSDELAPVNRSTGLIYPYPRGIGVLTETDKKIISPMENINTPCAPGYVIFITLKKEDESGDDTRYLELALARFSENIYEQLKTLPETKDITIVEDRLFPIMRLKLAKDVRIIPKIEGICNDNQVPIMYTLKGKTYAPDFNARPRLENMPVKEGVFQLSQNILNAHNSALLEEVYGGSRPKMLFELAGLMGNAKFYKITVGRLQEMVRLVKGICRKKT